MAQATARHLAGLGRLRKGHAWRMLCAGLHPCRPDEGVEGIIDCCVVASEPMGLILEACSGTDTSQWKDLEPCFLSYLL